MLQLVQSHTNFLASFKASSSDAAFEAALAAHAVRLRTALGNMPDPRLDDASAAMAILQHSCFTKHQKDELVATISAAVSCPSIAASKEGVSRLVPQDAVFPSLLDEGGLGCAHTAIVRLGQQNPSHG